MDAVIYYKTGYRYQLEDTNVVQTPITGFNVSHYFYHLEDDGELTLYHGFAWDGATFFPDLKSIMRSSAYHDAFYQMIASGKLPIELKQPVDAFLRDICIEDGMVRLLAKMVYRGVRLNKQPDSNPILSAP